MYHVQIQVMIVLKESDINATNAKPSKNTLPGGGYCDYGNMIERLDISLLLQAQIMPWCTKTDKWTNMVDLVSGQVGGAEVLGQVQQQLPPKNLQVGLAV